MNHTEKWHNEIRLKFRYLKLHLSWLLPFTVNRVSYGGKSAGKRDILPLLTSACSNGLNVIPTENFSLPMSAIYSGTTLLITNSYAPTNINLFIPENLAKIWFLTFFRVSREIHTEDLVGTIEFPFTDEEYIRITCNLFWPVFLSYPPSYI